MIWAERVDGARGHGFIIMHRKLITKTELKISSWIAFSRTDGSVISNVRDGAGLSALGKMNRVPDW